MAASLQGTLASLEENLSVLEILDRGAEGWPGVAASMEAMRAATKAAAALMAQQADSVKRSVRDYAHAMSELTRARDKSEELEQDLQRVQQEAKGSRQQCSRLRTQAEAAQDEAQRAQRELELAVRYCSGDDTCARVDFQHSVHTGAGLGSAECVTP